MTPPPRYVEDLERLGVDVIGPPGGFAAEAYLEACGEAIDLVIISREGVATRHLDAVKRMAPRARTVFDTVDLHYLRERRAAPVTGDREQVWRSRRRKLAELSHVRRTDMTLVVSPVEKRLLDRQCPGADIRVLPNIIEVPPDDPPGRDGRDGLLFIGGFRHAPNIDAVLYFVDEILPRIWRRSPGMIFRIAGSHPPDEVIRLASDRVEVLGYVPDLSPVLQRSLVSVAPLRYGAGVKGKVNQSMAHGVPTVLTPIAAEGMHLVHGRDALIAENPDDFAGAVLALADSSDLWCRLAIKGRASVLAHFSTEAVGCQIDAMLALAGLPRVEPGGSA
jgi:glycosyltransferase involved in cell wall biosynthesis